MVSLAWDVGCYNGFCRLCAPTHFLFALLDDSDPLVLPLPCFHEDRAQEIVAP